MCSGLEPKFYKTMIKSSIGKFVSYDKVGYMKNKFNFRQLKPTDSTAFATLAQNSPDTGKVGTLPKYPLDAYQVLSLRHARTVGIVAETTQFQGLVGTGLVSFDKCFFEGEQVDCASLHTLMVHPDYRRQGIGTELAQWRHQYALQQLGNGSLIAASIQQGNIESLATAQKWCQQIEGEIQGSVTRMRGNPPSSMNNVTVRLAKSNELDEIVHRQNRFYQDYNFYSNDTPGKLSEWLGQTPFDDPFRHYYVAVDSQGNILSGLVLKEQYKLVTMQVTRMPVWASFLNKFLAVVPSDGILKQLAAERFWYATNQLEAASYLWETLRWEWRDQAGGLVCFFDPRSPLSEILRLPAWMPKSKFTFAVHGPKKMSKERLVYYGI